MINLFSRVSTKRLELFGIYISLDKTVTSLRNHGNHLETKPIAHYVDKQQQKNRITFKN